MPAKGASRPDVHRHCIGIALRPPVVQCGALFTLLPFDVQQRSPKINFMAIVVQRALDGVSAAVHVLVVVVGDYLRMERLPGAGDFAGEIVSFWRDDARFALGGRKLATIQALASESGSPAVTVTGDRGERVVVERPDFQNCKSAMIEWIDRIVATNGVGFLHWIGHGAERSLKAGSISSLYCDGPVEAGSTIQAGLDWSRTASFIDRRTAGRPVHCFIDACRQDDGAGDYDGIGYSDYTMPDSAMVFRTSVRGEPSFWIDEPEDAVVKAGCKGQAIGTRAFLAALEGFGAQLRGAGDEHPVIAHELVQAASALGKRWSAHQRIPGGSTTGPMDCRTQPILLTNAAQSIVDFNANGSGPGPFEARRSDSTDISVSETARSPFQFRLARKLHKFGFRGEERFQEQPLFNPHMVF